MNLCRYAFGLVITACLACTFGCSSLERGIEGSMVLTSRIKSPVTIDVSPVNKPFSVPKGPPAANNRAQAIEENFSDLRDQETVTIVCLSGGGARAARFAAHALGALEEHWNEGDSAPPAALFDAVDIWSTVSGGSLYASWIAIESVASSDGKPLPPHRTTFQTLQSSKMVRLDTMNIGALAGAFYLSPGNLGYAPLAMFFTEWDTLNLFSRTHAFFQEHLIPILPIRELTTLGRLPSGKPRFFFNCTSVDTGRPFVITRNLLHNPAGPYSEPPGEQNPFLRWVVDRSGKDLGIQGRLLPWAITLEDLGSDPSKLPLCYAAFGSAAFPVVFDPLRIRNYSVPAAGATSPRHEFMEIVDGGIYDNLGAATALEIVDYLRGASRTKPLHVVLLLIDANSDTGQRLNNVLKEDHVLRAGFPIRGVLPGIHTVLRSYSIQESLTKALVKLRVAELQSFQKEKPGANFSIDYFELNLAEDTQASDLHIPTDFTITSAQDRALHEAAKKLWSRNYESESVAKRAYWEAFRDAVTGPRSSQ